MKHLFTEDMSPQQRRQILADNCDGVEEMTYTRQLSPEEMAVAREELSENRISTQLLDEEKKSVLKEFKMREAPLKDSYKEIMGKLRTRVEEKTGNVYKFANHDTSMMEFYDEAGEMVFSRRLRPEEKQARLFVAKAVNE